MDRKSTKRNMVIASLESVMACFQVMLITVSRNLDVIEGLVTLKQYQHFRQRFVSIYY